MKDKEIVIEFNNCINSRDIDGLSRLLADDYVFIDSENTAREGKQTGINDWSEFFRMFPDYMNNFDEFIEKEDMIIILGNSVCSDERLSGPAIWTAKIKDEKIYEWRVYEDKEDIRKILKIY